MKFDDHEIQKLDLLAFLGRYLALAKRHLTLAFLLIGVCVGIFAGSTCLCHRPAFTATASFAVESADPRQTYDLRFAEQISKAVPRIIGSDLLRSRAEAHLGIGSLESFSVSADASGNVITLQIEGPDPQQAFDVCSAILECLPDVTEYVVGPTVLTLLDTSGVPTEPSNPPSFTAALQSGLTVGILLWLAFLLLLTVSESTVHSDADLRGPLEIPCLASLPDTGTVAESVRELRVRVERAMTGEKKRILLVSGAIAGEGATTVSVNLALSLAQKGHRVLLIDCDLRNPSVAASLGISPPLSMADYLSKGANVWELITPTGLPTLSVISGGTGKHPNVTEMLSRERIQRLIYTAGNLFDYVILDTPPCSLSADAAEIAAFADCGLMVIRRDYASRSQILEGIRLLGDTGLPMLGCIINRIGSGSCGHGKKRKEN